MTKATPAPWTFQELKGDDARGQGYIYGPDGREISHHGVMERWREENLANAALTIAARDLLAALKEYPILSKYHGQHGFELERFISDYEAWTANARNVTAKAEGKS